MSGRFCAAGTARFFAYAVTGVHTGDCGQRAQ